jgi:threonine/homoserine/homoserine lactone efflux protein
VNDSIPFQSVSVGLSLIVLGATMVLLAEVAGRGGSSWLKQSELREFAYALTAGVFVTAGLFMILPAPS